MKLTQQNETEYSWFSTLVCVACFITNLSQMPVLVESALTRVISVPIWLLLAAICLMKDTNIRLGKTAPFWVCAIIFILYYNIANIFNENYGRSGLTYSMFLSFFVLLVGLMAGRHLELRDLWRIGDYYLVSGMLVCINVYVTYIHGNSIYGPSYLYASKNSVSQILLTAWILILLTKFNEKGFWKRAFWLVALCFLTWTLLALKSRATLIVIPILVVRFVCSGRVNKRMRNLVVLLLLGVVLLLMFNEKAYDVVVNQVLLRGVESDDVNAVASGRAGEWAKFPEEFAEVWLFGAGRMKRESLILTALLEFGLFIGGLILYMAAYPLVWGVRNLDKQHPIRILFLSVAFAYLLNCVFEQIAPFGPGVKCYFLWFMFGILAGSGERIAQSNEYDGEECTCEQ